jgi:hypothetical protein
MGELHEGKIYSKYPENVTKNPDNHRKYSETDVNTQQNELESPHHINPAVMVDQQNSAKTMSHDMSQSAVLKKSMYSMCVQTSDPTRKSVCFPEIAETVKPAASHN